MTTLKKQVKARARRKDYEKKHNVMQNNVPRSERTTLKPGDGILPVSRKNRVSKAEANRRKKAAGNIIKTATSR